MIRHSDLTINHSSVRIFNQDIRRVAWVSTLEWTKFWDEVSKLITGRDALHERISSLEHQLEMCNRNVRHWEERCKDMATTMPFGGAGSTSEGGGGYEPEYK